MSKKELEKFKKDMRERAKFAARSKESAQEYLKTTGIYTKTGRLKSVYKD